MPLPAPFARTPSTALEVRKRLSALGCETHFDYLRSPHWQRLRRRYKGAYHLAQVCICGEERIELHHRTYERLGCEELTDLFPLCRMCHAMVHVFIRRGLITVECDPTLFRNLERAEAYTAEMAPAVARAAEEFAATRKVLPTDRGELLELRQRTRDRRRAMARTRALKDGTAVRKRKTPARLPRQPDQASPEDMRHRTFDP